MELLSDADPHCREASRATLVSLFSKASAAAKSDLKRELQIRSVRKPVADAIIREVLADEEVKATAATGLTSDAGAFRASPNNTPNPSDRNSTGTPASDDNISPAYIASRGDLERTFAGMLPSFQGKETEQNWAKREASMVTIRGMLRAQVHSQFSEGFSSSVRQMSEGILKAVASLRTTLSVHGIYLIAELADHMGSDFPDACVDAWLPPLLKMAGFTKRIVANASQGAVSAILQNVPYRHKFMSWLWAGMQDKMVPTRISMAENLGTLLKTHARYRASALESHDGIQIMSQILKKALSDPSKDVRVKARAAFYAFEVHWSSQADGILDSLDASIKKQVLLGRNDFETGGTRAAPHNLLASPAPSTFRSSTSSATSGSSSAFTTPMKRAEGPGPSSAILAAKRAAATRMTGQRMREINETAQNMPRTDIVPKLAPESDAAEQNCVCQLPQTGAMRSAQPRDTLVLDEEDLDDTLQLGAESSRVDDSDASVTLDLMAPMKSVLVVDEDVSQDQSAAYNSSIGDETVSAAQHTIINSMQTAVTDSVSNETQNHQPVSLTSVASNVALSPILALQRISLESGRTPAAGFVGAVRFTAGHGWFRDRTSRLEASMLASPLKSKPDARLWIERIRAKEADVGTFKQLAKLSAAFRVSASPYASGRRYRLGYMSDQDAQSGITLQRGPTRRIERSGGKAYLQGEVDQEISDSEDSSAEDNEDLLRKQMSAWREDHLFERLFEALEMFFASPDFPCGAGKQASSDAECSNESTAALILLHKLVENQFPLFPAMSLEARLLRLAFTTIGGRKVESPVKRRIEIGCTSVLQTWSTKTFPASGVEYLNAETIQSKSNSESWIPSTSSPTPANGVLLCSTLSALFRRMPMAVVMEDELPRFKNWILQALNDQMDVELRRAAIGVLVSACHEVSISDSARDSESAGIVAESLLKESLGEAALRKDQIDLVLYYLARS